MIYGLLLVRVKASFSFHKITPKITQTHTGILVCHSIPFLPYFIILDKNNSVKRSHPKWEQQSEVIFSRENTPEGRTWTHKSSFLQYKQVNVRNGNHEWLRMTNAFKWKVDVLCNIVLLIINIINTSFVDHTLR